MKGVCLGQGLFAKDVCLGAGFTFCRGYPPEEVFEEVLRRGGSISVSAGLGGPGTVVPLARAKDVPGTTCRAWALPAISTAFSLIRALLGVFIVTHVSNSMFPQTVSIDVSENAWICWTDQNYLGREKIQVRQRRPTKNTSAFRCPSE
ncbi:UNVERIFIED_CONTAM: hypothetical protein Sradi_3864200 [Sesamum radiatum]|uniref:Uncharacterized protein n=1 Tax=Sesamum radiatum TaxID=300843 RepID=A0AAW2Q244_SESRA